MKKESIAVLNNQFPATGLVRLPQVLSVFPVSRSAWWAGVKSGRYPAAVRISPNCTAWRAEEIHDLINRVISESENKKAA